MNFKSFCTFLVSSEYKQSEFLITSIALSDISFRLPIGVDIKFKEGPLNIKIDKTDNIFMTGQVSEIKKIDLEI